MASSFEKPWVCPVVDLEILRGDFSFTKMPAQLGLKTKKQKKNLEKGLTIFLSHFSLYSILYYSITALQ